MTHNFTLPIPTYQCRKRVRALKIKNVIENPRGYELHFEDERFCPIEVYRRGFQATGYFLIFEDGSYGWLPAATFEADYTLMDGEPVEMVGVQEAWEAAGGNPGVKASKADLMAALRQLDQVCDLADSVGPATQAAREVGK